MAKFGFEGINESISWNSVKITKYLKEPEFRQDNKITQGTCILRFIIAFFSTVSPNAQVDYGELDTSSSDGKHFFFRYSENSWQGPVQNQGSFLCQIKN